MTLRILGDWGSTNLRLWLCDGNRPIDRAEGPGITTPGIDFAAVLVERVAPWQDRADGPVLLCGMIGARNGWKEAPYQPCPASLDAWRTAAAKLDAAGMQVRIAPGLSGTNFGGAPDVMRGEETQVFGALALEPALTAGESVVVHPGTHSKWVRLVDATVTGFHTVMTGELYALFTRHSALFNLPGDSGEPGSGFADGLEAASREPVQTAFFAARSRQLLEGKSRQWALAYLSGLLIGGEMRSMLAITGVRSLTLVGDARLVPLYAEAAAHAGIAARTLDGEACAIAGLLAFAGADA